MSDKIHPLTGNTLLSSILDTTISLFSSVSGGTAYEVTIGGALKSFHSEKYAPIIREARKALEKGDKSEYKRMKAGLPVLTFSGKFDGGHKKTHLKDYSNVIVLDIDDLGEEELKRVKKCLSVDEYVFAYWVSPSNQGVKALVYLEYTYDGNLLDTRHKNAFNQLKTHFLDFYGIQIDSSGSDFSRLCFACWDRELVLKDGVVPFSVQAPVKKGRSKSARISKKVIEDKTLLTGVKNIKGRNSIANRKEIEAIIRYLKKRKRSITHNYQDWLGVAFAIVQAFNPDLGRKYFIQLSKLDIDKFDEAECLRMLDYCYRNSRGDVTFASLIYKAQREGYDKRMWATY